ELLKVLAEHNDIDAIWCFGDDSAAAAAKAASIGNLKQVFTNEGRAIDWLDAAQGEGRWFLQHAVQVKNIWVPYGEGALGATRLHPKLQVTTSRQAAHPQRAWLG